MGIYLFDGNARWLRSYNQAPPSESPQDYNEVLTPTTAKTIAHLNGMMRLLESTRLSYGQLLKTLHELKDTAREEAHLPPVLPDAAEEDGPPPPAFNISFP